MPADDRSIRSVVPVPPPDSQVSPLNTPSPPCPPLYAHCSIVRGKGKGGPTGGLKVLGVCRIQAASNPYAGKSQPIGETRTRYSRKFRVNRAKGDVCCPHLTAKRDQSDRLLAVNNGEKGGTRGDTGRLKGGKRAIARLFRTVDGMNDDPIFRRLFDDAPVVSALTDTELATARTAANTAVNPPPPTAAKLSCWLCGAATLPSPGGLCVRCEVRRLST